MEFSDKVRHSAHAVATIAWIAMVPIGFLLGWFESILFVSAASIYANFASHLAAWLADEGARLRRIERKLDSLSERTKVPPEG